MLTSEAAAPGARERIQQAAVELMGRKGVSGTTTQDISRRAKCSQAVIYKYWDSKEALAQERFEEAHRRLIEAMEEGARRRKTPAERVIGTLFGLLRFARRHPAEFSFLFHVFHSEYAGWLARHPKPRDVLLEEIQSAMKTGEIPPGDASLKAALLLGMTIRLAFFEKQNLLDAEREARDEGLWQAAAAVLES